MLEMNVRKKLEKDVTTKCYKKMLENNARKKC